MLEVKNLKVQVAGKPILNGLTITVKEGDIIALMGPNGSGKSTLAQVLMGNPDYQVTSGSIRYQGEDLLTLLPEERARRGLLLAWQYPQDVAGVTIGNLLRLAHNARFGKEVDVLDFFKRLMRDLKSLGLPESLISRSVNESFSGGEKKRLEMLQLLVLQPRLAILDEIDSGLDIDAIKLIASAIENLREQSPPPAVVIITHYQRILRHLSGCRIMVIKDGKIVRRGRAQLLARLEREGYAWLEEQP